MNNEYKAKNPVVIIVYNRPNITKKVFNVVRLAKPKELFVIADGPKESSEDIERCKKTREIFDNISWSCDLYKNYSDYNMGGPERIPSGLNWVFKNVQQAIILEHDCVPAISFFRFCDDLLDYYKIDNRIGMISGNNFQKYQVNNYSYYFSIFTHCWGWATWKRAWDFFDINISQWKELKYRNFLNYYFCKTTYNNFWYQIFERQFKNIKRHWDFAWTFNCWSQNMLTILPNKNLITNIGFGSKATNTKDKNSPFANMKSYELNFPLRHPPYCYPDYQADMYTQKYNFGPRSFLSKMITLKKSILSHHSEIAI